MDLRNEATGDFHNNIVQVFYVIDLFPHILEGHYDVCRNKLIITKKTIPQNCSQFEFHNKTEIGVIIIHFHK